MAGERNSRLSRIMSTASNWRLSTAVHSETGSVISGLSFKHWHQRMQNEHEILTQSGKLGFGLWKWCFIGCKPCRWFDSVDYNVKICKICLKFRTFKFLGTLFLIAIFSYIFMYSLLKNELLPGGTIFFMFVLFLAAYILGYSLMFIGLPSMFGNLLVGIIFGNMPTSWLPPFDKELLEHLGTGFEKTLLLIALIRAGLLLDLSRIKGRVQIILRISIFPLLSEFALVWLAGHILLNLPWEWSALQGTVLCIVSLASVTSVMEKNKQSGYGEDIHLSTVLIAASASDVVVGIFLYIICISYIFTKGPLGGKSSVLGILADVVEQIFLGLTIGIISGLLIAFFPDKRNKEAAALRILVIGAGAFAIASILNEFNMSAAGVLGALTMCLVASNMWEELGWHDSSNPVQYFYTMAYYFGQPVALSIVGFSMNFTKSNITNIGLSILVIIIGLTGREIVCFLTTLGKLYPTTKKEKIFICIAWFSKGTFQALLAFAIEYMSLGNFAATGDIKQQNYLTYSRCIKQTTVLAILLTTPFACYTLTLLTPVLLTKKESPARSTIDPNNPS